MDFYSSKVFDVVTGGQYSLTISAVDGKAFVFVNINLNTVNINLKGPNIDRVCTMLASSDPFISTLVLPSKYFIHVLPLYNAWLLPMSYKPSQVLSPQGSVSIIL